MLQRTERHIIVNDKTYDDLCFKSKNLYNYVNYILRQVYLNKPENIPEYKHLIKTFKYKEKEYLKIDEYELSYELARLNQVDYRSLPAQTAQQVIKLLYKNWKSFYKSLLVLNTLKAKPKLPKYKDKGGKNVVVFTNQNVKLKNGEIHFPKSTNLKPLKTRVASFNQVRIVPQSTCYVVEVVYEKEIEKHDLDDRLYLGIDLGINNLATCVDNVDSSSFIINGRVVKSINQFFNKEKARLHSIIKSGTSRRIQRLVLKRNNKVQDYFHKTSRFIINYCLENKIKNIVVGYNKDWKVDVELGKKNNQNFVQIPYLKLINQLKYKAEEVGMIVQDLNESYTSKCDGLRCECIEKHSAYLGRRIKRGLFQSSIGKVINADINGAINILRKVVGDDLVKDLINRGFVFNPGRISFC